MPSFANHQTVHWALRGKSSSASRCRAYFPLTLWLIAVAILYAQKISLGQAEKAGQQREEIKIGYGKDNR